MCCQYCMKARADKVSKEIALQRSVFKKAEESGATIDKAAVPRGRWDMAQSIQLASYSPLFSKSLKMLRNLCIYKYLRIT